MGLVLTASGSQNNIESMVYFEEPKRVSLIKSNAPCKRPWKSLPYAHICLTSGVCLNRVLFRTLFLIVVEHFSFNENWK